MSGPFKMKGWSPFRNDEEKAEKKRAKQIRKAIRRGDAPPVTKDTLQYYLDAVRGSKDILT